MPSKREIKLAELARLQAERVLLEQEQAELLRQKQERLERERRDRHRNH